MKENEFISFMHDYINNNYENIPSEFYLKDIIPNPQSHWGVFLHKAVDNREFPNIEFMGVIDGADKYRKITISNNS